MSGRINILDTFSSHFIKISSVKYMPQYHLSTFPKMRESQISVIIQNILCLSYMSFWTECKNCTTPNTHVLCKQKTQSAFFLCSTIASTHYCKKLYSDQVSQNCNLSRRILDFTLLSDLGDSDCMQIYSVLNQLHH